MNKQDQYVKYLMDKFAEFPEDGTSYIWLYDNTTLYYNKEGNLEDLENCDGDTYGYDCPSYFGNFNGLSVFKLNDDFGGEFKIILKDSNKVTI